MEKEILHRLAEVETRYRNLKRSTAGLLIGLITVVIAFGFSSSERFDVIRAKGIIIEDEKGQDRILIGAPIPYSKDRVRTDTALVREYWASKIFPNDPDRFMKYYKDYYHSAYGMVVMNEDGFDRVLIGDKLADSNVGKRMFESAGITWNDQFGFELGGAGVNTGEDGTARGVIGLDDPNGEALHLVSLEDGTKAMIIGGRNGLLMVGMSNENGQWFQNKEAFVGIKYFDTQGSLIWEQKMDSLTER